MRRPKRSIRSLMLATLGLMSFVIASGQEDSAPVLLESCAQIRQLGDTRRPICAEMRQAARGVQAVGQNVALVNLELRGQSCGAAVRRETPAYITLAIDQSAPMAEPNADGQPRLQAAQRALELFIDGLQLNNTLRSDRIAAIGFDESVQVVSGPAGETGMSSLSAFLDSASSLKLTINRLSASDSPGSNLAQALNTSRDLLTRLSVVSADGQVILPLSSDDIQAIDRAVPVMILVANRLEDSVELRSAINRSRLSLRNLRLFLVLLEDDGSASALIGPDLFDDIKITNSSIGMLDAFNQLSERAQPRQAASDLEVIYELNDADFDLRAESISQGGVARGSQIIWPVYQRLYAGETARLSFDVVSRRAGQASAGELIVSYTPCEGGARRIARLSGPLVEFQLPTPTPTFTPTATFTPTPTFAGPSPTPAAAVLQVTLEPRTETISQSPGIFNGLCQSDWTAFLPWIGALLALLLALFLLYRSLRNADMRGLRDFLCTLLKIITALYGVFLVWLFLQPVAGSLCPVPESVYFWRMDGRDSGIYITNENFAGGVPPQIVGLNREGCVGCHSVSTEGGLIAAVVGGVPRRLALQNFQNERLDLPSIDAVYTSFSPDGSQIAYSDSDANLYVLDIPTRQTRRLELEDANYGALMPSWSSDGQRIAYVRAPRRNIYSGLWVSVASEIYAVSPMGGAPQPLLTQAQSRGLNYYPSFSPDGR
ncbi:MAG: hypothetical protein RML73_04500, partial [Anaerolineae bacterium]|nr:hypothetical protein [Anaerolineae bacterium]